MNIAYFEKLSAEGNLVTELEARNLQNLERGQVDLKVPWNYIQVPYLRQDISTLSSFVNASFRPISLFQASYVPQVQKLSPLQISNLNYAIDYNLWERDRFFRTMPNAWYLGMQYTPNALGRTPSYAQILGGMNDAFSLGIQLGAIPMPG